MKHNTTRTARQHRTLVSASHTTRGPGCTHLQGHSFPGGKLARRLARSNGTYDDIRLQQRGRGKP